MDPRPTLVYADAHGVERRHFVAGARVRIGRLADCDLVLSDPLVSRQHCAIERVEKGWSIVDLESRFGTFVNDERIDGRKLLEPGARIRIGNTSLVFAEVHEEDEVTVAPLDSGILPAKHDVIDTAAVRLTRTLRDPNASGAAEMKALVEAVNDATAHLDEAARLTLLGRVLGEVLTGLRTPDVDRILAVTVDMAIRGLKAERGYALLREGESITRVGRDIGDLRGGSASIGERVATTGVPVLTVDAQNDSRLMEAQSVMLNDVRAVMCVPIPGPGPDGAPMGALYVDAKQRGIVVSAVGLELLKTLAMHAAAAIESAQRQSVITTGRSTTRAPRTGVHAIGEILATGEPALRPITVLSLTLRHEEAILDASPAEAVDLLNDLLTGLHEDIQAEAGVLDRYTAAGVTALWGAVRPQDDRIVRAARCALKLRARTAGSAERWRKQGRPFASAADALTCSIALHDGNALVGTIGSVRRLELTAMGETVKQAVALSVRAGDGEIVITEAALQKLGSRARAELAANTPERSFRLLDLMP